jgi:hypothetical protein
MFRRFSAAVATSREGQRPRGDIVERVRSGVAYEGIPIARDVDSRPINRPSHYQVQFSSVRTKSEKEIERVNTNQKRDILARPLALNTGPQCRIFDIIA